jgi:hypothetical protein
MMVADVEYRLLASVSQDGNCIYDFKAMATYIYETIPKNPKEKPRRFEVEQKMSDPSLKTDPESGLPVRRVITGGSGLVTHGASILSMKVKGSKR